MAMPFPDNSNLWNIQKQHVVPLCLLQPHGVSVLFGLILSFQPLFLGHWFSTAQGSQSRQFCCGVSGCLSPRAMAHQLIYGQDSSFHHSHLHLELPIHPFHSHSLVPFPLCHLQGNIFWKHSGKEEQTISLNSCPRNINVNEKAGGQWPIF